MEIPATVFVAFGAVLAALVAGFFSFANLVSSKENRVSEFRQSWIDGLRTEVAQFTSGTHELIRINEREKKIEVVQWLEVAAQPYRDVRESLTKIQLRLNPKHVKENPEGLDAKLMKAVLDAKDAFNKEDYDKTLESIEAVRAAAAPLLKEQWERVKYGELLYRRVRLVAWVTLVIGMFIVLCGSFLLLLGVPDGKSGVGESVPMEAIEFFQCVGCHLFGGE